MRLAPSRRTLRLRALPLLFLAALAAVPFVLVARYQPIYVAFGWDDPVGECFHEAWWASERQSRLEGPIQFFSPKRFALENDFAGLSKSEPVVATAVPTGGAPPAAGPGSPAVSSTTTPCDTPGVAIPEGDAALPADVLYPDPCDTLPRHSVRFINFYLVAFFEYSSYSDVFAEPYHEALRAARPPRPVHRLVHVRGLRLPAPAATQTRPGSHARPLYLHRLGLPLACPRLPLPPLPRPVPEVWLQHPPPPSASLPRMRHTFHQPPRHPALTASLLS